MLVLKLSGKRNVFLPKHELKSAVKTLFFIEFGNFILPILIIVRKLFALINKVKGWLRG